MFFPAAGRAAKTLSLVTLLYLTGNSPCCSAFRILGNRTSVPSAGSAKKSARERLASYMRANGEDHLLKPLVLPQMNDQISSKTFTAAAANHGSKFEGSAGSAESVLQQRAAGAASGSAAAELALNPVSHLDELIAGAFACFCLITLLAAVLFPIGPKAQVSALSEEKKRLSEEHQITIKEMQALLNTMNDSSGCLAERNFNAKRRSLQQFLDKIKKGPVHYKHNKGYPLVKPFQKFIYNWLITWQQCTLDPIEEPRPIVTWNELLACDTVVKVADLVERRLEKSIEVVSENMDQFGRGISKSTLHVEQTFAHEHDSWAGVGFVGFGVHRPVHDRDPTISNGWTLEGGKYFPMEIRLGLLKVTVMSETHAKFLFALLIGKALVALEIIFGKIPWVLVVVFGQVCLLVNLFGLQEFDQLAKLKNEVKALRGEKPKMDSQRKQMIEFHKKLESASVVWMCRTIPRFDNMIELMDRFLDAPEDLRIALMDGLNARLDAIEKAMGSLELFAGNGKLPQETLTLWADQLGECTRFINGLQGLDAGDLIVQTLNCMEQVFAFVYVRVIAAHNLEIVGQEPHVYVALQMEKVDNPLHRTATVDNVSPAWGNEEFLLPAKSKDKKLELHLRNETGSADHDSLGFVHVDFRKLKSGVWHKRKDNLASSKGSQQESDLEYEVFYATELAQLQDVNSAPVPVKA